MLTKNDLIDYFYRGIKDKNELRIGVEHEKFVLNTKDFKPVSYEEKNGIKEIFLNCIKLGWKPIYDDKNSLVTGLKKENEFITLEPGGQLELSGAPLKNIHETCNETTKHL
ncbi:MAG: glutamate--cysteine ligase, partial [Rickettsiales bacterium]|nr:glutamate--cysteine ligase [Rickettsiales bacterium]